MTTYSASANLSTVPQPLTQRLTTIVRLLAANPWTAFYWPLTILAFIFAGNLAIWVIVNAAAGGDIEGEFGSNGGAMFVYIYMLVVAVQIVNRSFGLALGYGATRRDFTLGSWAFYGMLSVGYAVLLATANAIEIATDGFGIRLYFFRGGLFGLDSWIEGAVFAFLILLLFFSIGSATAAVYVRWKTTGMYVFWASIVVLGLASAFLVTVTESWGAIGTFFIDNGVLGSAAWSLLLTGLGALCGWLVLRGATPRQG